MLLQDDDIVAYNRICKEKSYQILPYQIITLCAYNSILKWTRHGQEYYKQLLRN